MVWENVKYGLRPLCVLPLGELFLLGEGYNPRPILAVVDAEQLLRVLRGELQLPELERPRPEPPAEPILEEILNLDLNIEL